MKNRVLLGIILCGIGIDLMFWGADIHPVEQLGPILGGFIDAIIGGSIGASSMTLFLNVRKARKTKKQAEWNPKVEAEKERLKGV